MAEEPEPRARIIEIGGRSQALGGVVLLRVAEPFTVLVGQNGAGKSALLHLIYDGAMQARAVSLAGAPVDLGDEFQCTAEIAGAVYRYGAHASKTLSSERMLQIKWREQCTELSAGGTSLWSTDAGVVAGLGKEILVPPSTGLLAVDPNGLPAEVAPVAAAFGWLFRHMTLVPAGLPATAERRQIVFLRDVKTGSYEMQGGSGSPRLDRVARQLVHWRQIGDESFDRIQLVLRRMGVCETVVFKTYPEIPYAFIYLDEYGLDAASDGTLRVLEIVVALEMAAAGALVMIEEPETGIHPGLCDRIMAEIESAADSLQLIISTHSPRILDRVQYQQIRHVRRNGSTRIEELTAMQVEEVKAFLDHQGTLSEYVFSPDFVEEHGTETG